MCRHDIVCVHPYDVRSDHIKCHKSKDDKALTNVPACPPHCSCLGYAISCKFLGVWDFPQLPAALRVLLFDNFNIIDIHNITFTEGITFLLDLQITNANLEKLQQEHLSRFLFLKNLNLGYNRLKSLGPRTFLILYNLEIMDLSHNLLEALRREIFTGLRVLRQLNLNHNSIRLISHCTFQHLQKLGTLNLSHNKLAHLGKNILCGLSLKALDISYNSLSAMDENVFVYSFQHLKTLNTFPRRICCNVPNEFNCYPKVKLTQLSSCLRLFDSSAVRTILWLAGCILSSLIFPAVAWYIYQIRARANRKSLYSILSLLLFASSLYVCIYVFTIASIDHLSAGYYSFFDEPWRHHAGCYLLNTLSYAFFQTTLFVCILISVVRTIGTVYPFKAQDISLRALLVSISLWFIVSTFLGYSGIAWIFPEYNKSPESALGLGILLPPLRREVGNVPFHMLLFVVPNAAVLLIFCFLQALLILGLNRTSAISDASGRQQKKATRTSVISLLLFTLQYGPLLLVHILTILSVSIKENVGVIVTIWTLVFVPLGNVLLYVCFSIDFQRLFSKICYHFLRHNR